MVSLACDLKIYSDKWVRLASCVIFAYTYTFIVQWQECAVPVYAGSIGKIFYSQRRCPINYSSEAVTNRIQRSPIIKFHKYRRGSDTQKMNLVSNKVNHCVECVYAFFVTYAPSWSIRMNVKQLQNSSATVPLQRRRRRRRTTPATRMMLFMSFVKQFVQNDFGAAFLVLFHSVCRRRCFLTCRFRVHNIN